jgi:hypothetical protein
LNSNVPCFKIHGVHGVHGVHRLAPLMGYFQAWKAMSSSQKGAQMPILRVPASKVHRGWEDHGGRMGIESTSNGDNGEGISCDMI